MDEFFEKEGEDHYPVGGAIQFMQGDKQNFRNDTLTFRPEVGKMLVFPSWLKHSVYPFDVVDWRGLKRHIDQPINRKH